MYLLLQLLDQFVFDSLLFLCGLDQSEQSFSLSFWFFHFSFSLKQFLLHFLAWTSSLNKQWYFYKFKNPQKYHTKMGRIQIHKGRTRKPIQWKPCRLHEFEFWSIFHRTPTRGPPPVCRRSLHWWPMKKAPKFKFV